jgi:hypothetical protein
MRDGHKDRLPLGLLKLEIVPGKFGHRIKWDWRDWIGATVLIIVVVALIRGDSAFLLLKEIGTTLGSIIHR